MWFLLGEDYESDELLSADLRKALTSTLLPQIAHEVKDCFATQDLVAHVSTHHDGRLVMQDGGGVAWPDGQPRIDGTGSQFFIPNLIKVLFSIIEDFPLTHHQKTET